MFTIADLNRAFNSKLNFDNKNNSFKEVVIDSRKVKQGFIFFAIIGPNQDGHDYIDQAVENGAKCVVVSRSMKIQNNVCVFKVKDTTRALGDLARLHRQKFKIPIIGITGSAGKTTTKDFIYQVLKTKYRVLKNERSENNQYGIPLTLCRLNKQIQIAVVEVGTNQKGDIEYLADIVRPTMVVFTNIGPSHLLGLKSIAGVFKEKMRLMDHLNHSSKVVYNGDDKYLKRITLSNNNIRRITFGLESQADYRAQDVRMVSNRKIHFKVNRQSFELQSVTKHNVYNALAAISCGRVFNIRYNEIKRALKSIRIKNNRMQITSLRDRILLLDDTYNANPLSYESALFTLSQLESSGRRICICADMGELGKYTIKYHTKLARQILKLNLDVVFTFGKESKLISTLIKSSNQVMQSQHFTNYPALAKRICNVLQPSDVLLIKGSRFMKMERLANQLKEEFS